MSAKFSIMAGVGRSRSMASPKRPVCLRNQRPIAIKKSDNISGSHSATDMFRTRLGDLKVTSPRVDAPKLNVKQIIAQAQLSDTKRTHRLVVMSRTKASKLLLKKGKGFIILGSANLPAEELCANLLKVTTPSQVAGLEALNVKISACGSPDGGGFGHRGCEVMNLSYCVTMDSDAFFILIEKKMQEVKEHLNKAQKAQNELEKMIKDRVPAPSDSEIQRKKADEEKSSFESEENKEENPQNEAEQNEKEPADKQETPSKFFRTDKNLLDVCQRVFNDIIAKAPPRGKQKILAEIKKPAHSIYFNPSAFSHEELANELNRLQNDFVFKKADVDAAYKKNS